MKNLCQEIIEKAHQYNQTLAEVCGLWVEKSFRGLNLPYCLLRSVLCVCPKLRIESILAFPPNHTKGLFVKLGFDGIENVGRKGEFMYPDERYISTLMELKNVNILDRLQIEDLKIVERLRCRPKQMISEKKITKMINIQHDLRII